MSTYYNMVKLKYLPLLLFVSYTANSSAEILEEEAVGNPIVTNIYTADPSAHVFGVTIELQTDIGNIPKPPND